MDAKGFRVRVKFLRNDSFYIRGKIQQPWGEKGKNIQKMFLKCIFQKINFLKDLTAA